MSLRGLLVAGLQYLDSWTLVVTLRRRARSNKGTDLGDSFNNGIRFLFCFVFQRGRENGREGKACQSLVLCVPVGQSPFTYSRNETC